MSFSVHKKKRMQSQTRSVVKKRSSALLNSIVEKELRRIATEVYQAEVVDVEERLSQIRDNLHKLWYVVSLISFDFWLFDVTLSLSKL